MVDQITSRANLELHLPQKINFLQLSPHLINYSSNLGPNFQSSTMSFYSDPPTILSISSSI